VVCARLSYPNRWYTLADLFDRSPSWLSIVFNDTVIYLCNRFKKHLRWHRLLTDYTRLKAYTKAVKSICRVDGIYGFIDGTFKGYCRPTEQKAQGIVYSGHKRNYGYNWQVVTAADGLSLFCIVVGGICLVMEHVIYRWRGSRKARATTADLQRFVLN
jgi:hypothetical protein